MSVNKVILIGNLGADPDINIMPSGETVMNLRLATTLRWNDKNSGERKEETEWHRISVFGKTAESLAQFLKKGRQIYVEGRLKTRKFADKDTGADRYSTEIVASTIQLLGSRTDNEGSSE
jgi:single-strand DNA-binding protein